jgi:hypothetical protein
VDADDFITANTKQAAAATANKKGSNKKRRGASLWLVSEAGGERSSQTAVGDKRKRSQEAARVRDGASAPKLTGRERHAAKRLRSAEAAAAGAGAVNKDIAEESKSALMLSDPAALAAVLFGLGLLVAALRKGLLQVDDEATRAMAAPFVPLLRRYVLVLLMLLLMPSVMHHVVSVGTLCKVVSFVQLVHCTSDGCNRCMLSGSSYQQYCSECFLMLPSPSVTTTTATTASTDTLLLLLLRCYYYCTQQVLRPLPSHTDHTSSPKSTVCTAKVEAALPGIRSTSDRTCSAAATSAHRRCRHPW